MIDFRILVVIVAGLSSGAILGAAIPTETEQKVRQGAVRWALFSHASIAGILMNQLLELVVISLAFMAVGVSILQLGDVYPLCQTDRYVLTLSWFAGAGLAKWARYIYWKRRSVWS